MATQGYSDVGDFTMIRGYDFCGRIIILVTSNVRNGPAKSEICHQYKLSPTSVTNNNVAFGWLEEVPVFREIFADMGDL